MITLGRYLIQKKLAAEGLSHTLSDLLNQLAEGAKSCSLEISRESLAIGPGLAGTQNSSGDEQKKLDLVCNRIFLDALEHTNLVWALASEEEPGPVCVSCQCTESEYLLVIDPIDGSSNIGTNSSLGTIFGIYPKLPNRQVENAFQGLCGKNMIGAGYILYGTSTTLVFSIGRGVQAFTLDRELGEFVLVRQDIRCPQQGKYYCNNLARIGHYEKRLQDFIGLLNDQNYSLRYSGALIADFHRVLIEGGIFFYPADKRSPDGKLRLLYEGAPLAFLAAQAGGHGTDSVQSLLEIPLESIHQRTPVFLGSTYELALLANA